MTRIEWRIDRGLRPAAASIASASIVVFGGLVALLAGAALLIFGDSERDIVLLFGINAVLVVGLQAFVGNTGILSFGHVAFMGIGAYAAGIATIPVALKISLMPDLPVFLQNRTVPVVVALFLGGVAAAAFALLTAPLFVRLTGDAAAIMTFGLLVIVNEVLRNADTFTRGTQTFIGVPEAATFTLIFGTLLVVVALSAAFKWSSVGLRARTVRDDILAAEAAGIAGSAARILPWVISAFITGVGGALWAFQVTAFSPNSFFIAQSVGIIAMMILGGMQSISGALLGASLMTIWLELMRHVEGGDVGIAGLHIPARPGIADFTLGVLIIGVLLLRPSGIVGSREFRIDLVGPRNET